MNEMRCNLISSDCIIEIEEKEICCKNARQCCIFCIEDGCPIKWEYKEFLQSQQEKINYLIVENKLL